MSGSGKGVDISLRQARSLKNISVSIIWLSPGYCFLLLLEVECGEGNKLMCSLIFPYPCICFLANLSGSLSVGFHVYISY